MRQLMLIYMVCFAGIGFAQQPLLSGRITFEKNFSVIKAMDADKDEDDEDNTWYIEMRKKLPKYKTDIFQLNFNVKQTLYTTLLEDENPLLRWHKTITELSQKTVFEKDSTWANRTVYDKTYLVADSISEPVWKLTGEYREIAGFNCRRATTILYDSVYVIAFFTDAIPLPGGPDLFAGLPGMILGVVIPRMHTTIFATKVEAAALTDADFIIKFPRKPNLVNREGYRKDLSGNIERWGSYGNKFVLKALF